MNDRPINDTSLGETVARRFVAPPNWPQPPTGWSPPDGWQAPVDWGQPPEGWQFWVDDADEPAPAVGKGTPTKDVKVSRFGARKQARSLAAEVADLQRQLETLGALDIAALDRRRQQLQHDIKLQESRLRENEERHLAEFQSREQEILSKGRREAEGLALEIERLRQERDRLRAEVVETEETVILQEVGVYQARHPLDDSTAYKAEIARLQDSLTAMARKDGGAVEAAKDWTVNGSAAKGRAMVNEYSKLVLRAYNAEADNLVRAMRPYKLQTSTDRLEKVARTIERLGRTMNIRISNAYHRLRIRELELTADYLDKVADEREREREERERLREERRAQQELEAERRRLQKERQHYANALTALLAQGDTEGAERLRGQLADIDRAIENVDYRAANVRAGYVYVISNVGAFGDRMVKIGMTRRLEPMDRVRELGDASVPFRFDVHALFFSEDAVGIENAMHTRFNDQRVNKVNTRREFFYITPREARDALAQLTGDLLSFTDFPEAVEFRQSGGLDALPTAP